MSEELKINKAYAENYNVWRKKEELQKLKDKYGDVSDLDSESSSSESEDENAEGLTALVERDWLRTYAALKKRDPKIYQKDVKFYHSDDDTDSNEGPSSSKVKGKKPVYLKDYERKVILEKGGKLVDESDSDEEENFRQKPSYYEEQDEIKQSFKSAFEDSGSESSDPEFLTKKVKTEKEKVEEDTDFMSWANEEKKGKKEDKKFGVELGSLKQYWNDPNLDEGEKFLRDFIVKQQYLDKDADRIPSYDEIINDGDGLTDDEENVEKQEEFERKYNFRYEEPDQDFIKSFPRTIDDSVRRKESKRADRRKQLRDRKKMEKDKRKEEIKQLKNMKKQEIMDKIDKLKEIAGNQSLGLNTEDLEGDFDPDKHDQMMKSCFDDDFYGGEEEDIKPVFADEEDDDLIPENWDNWTGPDPEDVDETEPHMDDPNFIMDADYDPTKAVEKTGKKKRKSKFKQALAKKKPVFDPEKKTFEEYYNDYYSLDYEDIIDDKPCRFRYRTVLSNDYGLSVDEVLTARDKELNAWASLKKMSQYRTEEEEMEDLKIYSHKSKNTDKKAKMLPSLNEKSNKTKMAGSQKNKRKKKNKGSNEEKGESIEEKGDSIEEAGASNIAKVVLDSSVNVSDVIKSENTETVNLNTTEKLSDGKKRKMTDQQNNAKKKKKKLHLKEEQSVTAEDITLSKEKITVKEKIIVQEKVTVKETVTLKEKKIKKKKKKKQLLTGAGESSNTPQEGTNKSLEVSQELKTGEAKTKKKKKKKKKKKLPILSDERLKAYGINPKKLRYMKTDNFKQKVKAKE
ncbi:protein KRI1 homolog isoform X2 [Mytilus edulis]|uniref:protein KRI1 homolog isoform X1 n=1 Tax=Mytilus edulis TaxID=6550 RepID=UPI0039F08090